MHHCAWPTWLPKVRWPRMGSLGRVRARATRNCTISALVGPLHRKWRNQVSSVGLPLELEVTWPEGPLWKVLSRTSASYNLIIFYEIAFSLVICPFPAILFSLGAPSIITFLTKVSSFRICSRCCVVIQVVYHVRVLTVVFLLHVNNLRVKSHSL